eukprot:scaffold339223_cov11-Prasinocladus_malaysianus.AAC.1
MSPHRLLPLASNGLPLPVPCSSYVTARATSCASTSTSTDEVPPAHKPRCDDPWMCDHGVTM